MVQFAVHRNKNPISQGSFPLLLDVQSDLLGELQTRVVIPLGKATSLGKKPISRLMPVFPFQGESYVLVTPLLAGIPRKELGAAVGTLADCRDAIISALDFLVLGF
ncbi:MAG: CcdB family protein [Alphaproteobacteria bacterium]|nr:CcdB family protein [Alphaproteobacteria bacterium]MBV8413471.1 CcdB family protein [Alphaproteobacteria bacterium]